MEILVIVLIAVVIIGGIVLNHLAARQRREALAALAAKLGLTFRPDEDPGLAEQLDFLRKLDLGSHRYAYNLLRGRHRGHEVMLFDFHYQTTSGAGKSQRTQHFRFSVLTLVLPRTFPELIVTPEGLLSKIAQAIGFDDIDLESAEFSRTFCVRSRDRKFAYDVCHPRMMEYLLAHRDLELEIDGNLLALVFDDCLEPAELETRLAQLIEIRMLLPDYLLTKA